MIKAVTGGETPAGFVFFNGFQNNNYQEVSLGVKTSSIGFRGGHTFLLGTEEKHFVRLDLSFSKHISSSTKPQLNGENLENLNTELDKLLWDKIFKPYGFVGGFGVSYNYKIYFFSKSTII